MEAQNCHMRMLCNCVCVCVCHWERHASRSLLYLCVNSKSEMPLPQPCSWLLTPTPTPTPPASISVHAHTHTHTEGYCASDNNYTRLVQWTDTSCVMESVQNPFKSMFQYKWPALMQKSCPQPPPCLHQSSNWELKSGGMSISSSTSLAPC